MRKTNMVWLNVYVLISITHIMSIVIGNVALNTYSKYALIPALILHVWKNRVSGDRSYFWLLSALLFSWIGDGLLLYTQVNEIYFLLGLASFLLAHVAYIISFRKAATSESAVALNKLWILLPVGYAGTLIALLIPHLGDMMVPVVAYALIITAMCVQAMLRFGKTSGYSYWFVLIGAIIFIASDSMIAWSTFHTPFDLSRLLIMSTYIVAQYLLVSGLLLHERPEVNPSPSDRS